MRSQDKLFGYFNPILGLILITFTLLLSACGEQVARSTPEYFIPPTLAQQAVQVSLDTPTHIIPTPTLDCDDNLTFIEDVTVPDYSVFAPGDMIDKVWRVENSGTCNWDANYRIRFIEGDALGAEHEQALFPARSGTESELRITFVAPNYSGEYYGKWQAYTPEGQPFGDWFSIIIDVDQTLAPTPAPTPVILTEEITFQTEDGVDIAATLYGEGDLAVIFLHMDEDGSSQRDWQPFARMLTTQDIASLTVDFRGIGKSGGDENPNMFLNDLKATVEFLQSREFENIACVGAGYGGAACLRYALENPFSGIIVISSSQSLGNLNTLTEDDFALLTLPKLFIYGDSDGLIPILMTEMISFSPSPKELVTYDSAAHGTHLFESEFGEDFTQTLLEFLLELK